MLPTMKAVRCCKTLRGLVLGAELWVWSAPASTLAASTVLAAAVVSTSAHAETAAADDSDEAKRAQDITRTVMSPFCPGRTLEACPSPYATEWREDIREWVAEGVSTEEIKKRLKARTPDKDLTGTPSTVMDSVLPALVSVVAVVLLVLLLRGLLRPTKVSTAASGGGRVRRDVDKQEPGDGTKRKSEPKSEATLERELDEELERLDD